MKSPGIAIGGKGDVKHFPQDIGEEKRKLKLSPNKNKLFLGGEIMCKIPLKLI